jgi:phosphoserine aminotransferase
MRIHNFSAGPCTLPLEVLAEARDEFVDYHGAGAALIEMSHRSPEYDEVHVDALAAARRLAGAPDDFDVLFLQGGATLQFAMVPMNLLGPGDHARYALTGSWSQKAYADARHHGGVDVAWDGADVDHARTPGPEELRVGSGDRYLHLCSNETIGGLRWPVWPDVGVPLAVDMSSEYLARPIPWDLVDVVYGGVQKNLGPAGLTIVFVRRSVLDRVPHLATYLSWATHARTHSLHNTPPVFAVWITGKVLRWLEGRGGVAALEADAAHKAGLLYDVIDGSAGYYRCPVEPAHRSHMNVVFRLPSPDEEARFVVEATERGLANLKGHRSVGGIRASVYAAMPVAGVEELAGFMTEFAAAHR